MLANAALASLTLMHLTMASMHQLCITMRKQDSLTCRQDAEGH